MGTGSGFGRKIGRDGGIEKKRWESGIWEPLLWTLFHDYNKISCDVERWILCEVT